MISRPNESQTCISWVVAFIILSRKHTLFVRQYEAKCGQICCCNAFSWAGEESVGVLCWLKALSPEGGWWWGCHLAVAEKDKKCEHFVHLLYYSCVRVKVENIWLTHWVHTGTYRRLYQIWERNGEEMSLFSDLTIKRCQIVRVTKLSCHRYRLAHLHIGFSAS